MSGGEIRIMIGYAVLLAIISLTMFFCFVDYKGVFSSKILLLLMFLIMAFATSNADMAAYKGWYEYINSIDKIVVTDPAFGLLMYIGNLLGLGYYGFLKALTVLGLAFVWLVFKRKSLCPAAILAMYFALVFLTLTIQIRAFIAETIIYILITEMVNRERFSIWRFCFILTVAVLFHASSLFFALLLIIPIVKDRKKRSLIVTVAIAIVPSSAIILRYVPIPMIQEKINYYLITQRTSFFSAVFLFVLLYICILWLIDYTRKGATDVRWQGRLGILEDINIIGLIACALIVVFNSSFYRMIRIIMIADFLVLGNYYIEMYNMRLKNRAFVASLNIVFFLSVELLTKQLLDIITNNSLLSVLLDIT